ncbi:acylphosphatase [Kocuria palustris]|uniref:acylphosphatase n=1 Tax=Kocuria palustris TaxID=71999 RepID=UPI00195BA175|nr:acylphosphatase [Kocuria palustris]MBM7822733.1 acylphosphatase [Kocuria palustris]
MSQQVAARDEEDGLDTRQRLRAIAIVHGTVQGVGFRYWTWKHAEKLGLVGCARNLDDGTVEVIAEGTRWAVRDLLKEIQGPDAPGAVMRVDAHFEDPQGDLSGFTTA